MNEGVHHQSSTSDFSRGCMNENFEIPLKVIGHETSFSGNNIQSLEWNSNIEIGGFDLKKNFEIEPSLGMGIRNYLSKITSYVQCFQQSSTKWYG